MRNDVRYPDSHALPMGRETGHRQSVYKAAAVMLFAWEHKIGLSRADVGSWLAPRSVRRER